MVLVFVSVVILMLFAGADERRSVSSSSRSLGSEFFNNFIDGNTMVYIPLIGRRFTRYRRDGHSMSRIDRFLLSEIWCLRWPNCIQVAQLHSLSDHCEIILSVDEQNWGPKPFRMLKCWVDFAGYKDFITSKWRSLQVEGWAGYVLKEKLKMIKVALREWHQNHTQNILGKISVIKDRMSVLDERGE